MRYTASQLPLGIGKTDNSTPWGWDQMASIFQMTFSNGFSWMKISLKVPMGPMNSIPGVIYIMAWHWPGNNPLSEPMMVSLLMHIYVTQSQWVISDVNIQIISSLMKRELKLQTYRYYLKEHLKTIKKTHNNTLHQMMAWSLKRQQAVTSSKYQWVL